MTDEWFADERFWTELAPLIMFGEGSERKARLQARVLSNFFSPGARILDLACGMGWQALELAPKFRVTAVDRSAALLDQARRSADAQGLAVEFVQEDMRAFVRPDWFDGILNLSTSFGFFEEARQDLEVLANMFQSLRPSGLLILDMIAKDHFERRFVPRSRHRVGDSDLVVERSVKRQGTWVEERWTRTHQGKHHHYSLSYRLYSAAALSRLLDKTGFRPVEIWGDWTGTPHDEKSSRLIALAHRPRVET